eukprot:140725_1
MSSCPFTNSYQLPCSWQCYLPKPSYHPTNKNCIIITTHYDEKKTTPGIYTYDIVTNKSQIIYKYNNTFKPWAHGQFIDISNNTLILYGGDNDTFKIFDLNTNEIKQINDTNTISKYGYYPQSAFIASISQIHILDYKCNHYKFNIANKETIE